MSLIRTTLHNILYLLFARLGYRITTAVALIIIARTVQSEQYGIYTTALGWSTALLALNDLGLNTYLLKTASKKDPAFSLYFGNTLLLQTILSLLITISLTVLGSIVFSPPIGLLMGVVSFGQLAYEFRKTFRAVFRSQMKLKSVALTEFGAGLLFLIGVFCIAYFRILPKHTLFAFAGMSVIAQCINITILGKRAIALVRPTHNINLLPDMLKAARHFFVYNIGILLAFQIDQIFISLFLSPEAVSVYSAPAQIALVFLFVPLMVFQATTPLLFEWYEKNKQKYRALLLVQWRYLTALGVVVGVSLAVLASPILNLIYGQDFFSAADQHAAEWILRLFGIFLALRFCSISLVNALMTSDHADMRMRYQIYALLCNVILDIILIPRIGPLGGAIATLATEFLLTTTLMFTHHRIGTLSIRTLFVYIIKIALPAILMAITMILIEDRLPVIVVVVLGIALYLCLLYIMRFYTADDRALLAKSLFSKTSVKNPTL